MSEINWKDIVSKSGVTVVVSAVGKDGSPYSEVALKTEIKNGKLAYYELLESSQMQKNLVYSLWFNKAVSVLIIDSDGKNYQLKGKVYRAWMAGRDFEEEYVKILKEQGAEADLSTIWLIEIEDVLETTYDAGRIREKTEHPYMMHWDHIYLE